MGCGTTNIWLTGRAGKNCCASADLLRPYMVSGVADVMRTATTHTHSAYLTLLLIVNYRCATPQGFAVEIRNFF